MKGRSAAARPAAARRLRCAPQSGCAGGFCSLQHRHGRKRGPFAGHPPFDRRGRCGGRRCGLQCGCGARRHGHGARPVGPDQPDRRQPDRRRRRGGGERRNVGGNSRLAVRFGRRGRSAASAAWAGWPVSIPAQSAAQWRLLRRRTPRARPPPATPPAVRWAQCGDRAGLRASNLTCSWRAAPKAARLPGAWAVWLAATRRRALCGMCDRRRTALHGAGERRGCRRLVRFQRRAHRGLRQRGAPRKTAAVRRLAAGRARRAQTR